MGVKDYVYRANQSMPTCDHKLRLDLIEQMDNSIELLLIIKYTIGGQINLSQLDPAQHSVVDELFDNGLINRVLISDDDKVLELLDKGNLFIDKAVKAMIQLDMEKSKLFLDNMSSIREHAEGMGAHSYLRTLIAFAQLISMYYYQKKDRLDNLLVAINHTWDESILDKPDNFNKLFFARYYSRLQEIYREANIVEEERDIDLNRIPTSTDEVVDITKDPLEDMEVVSVRKVKRASPHIPKKVEKQVEVNDIDWVKEYDTPTADRVNIVEEKSDNIQSIMIDDYVILGDGGEISLDKVLSLDIDKLKINTRSKHLLKEKGIDSIKQLRDFNKAFVSINGIGEKSNDMLSGLRKQLRNMKKPEELIKHLSDEGKKEYVLGGGTVDNMDHSYLRRIDEDELKEIEEVIESGETPLEMVGAATKWILEKLGRNPGDKIEDMLNDLGLLQERSNPLLFTDKLIKLGFPYVYKKQDEFEESMEYVKVIAELREYIMGQMTKLVLPVQTIQSAASLIEQIGTLEMNPDERTSFSTASAAYQSNDFKSSYSLFYTTFEGYLRRACEKLSITPELEERDPYVADLIKELNSKYKMRLVVKPFMGELREIRNAIAHGNNIHERRVEAGLNELLKYILQSIERITEIKQPI